VLSPIAYIKEAVASLSSPPSSQGRRWLYTPWRRVTTTLATTTNDSTTTSLPQAADNHHNPYLYRNQPTAITLQTTTATPTFTATNLQLSRCRQPPQPPSLPQPVYSCYAVNDRHTTDTQQGYRRGTAGVPHGHRRRTADAPQTQTTTTTTTIIHHNTPHCRRRVYYR